MSEVNVSMSEVSISVSEVNVSMSEVSVSVSEVSVSMSEVSVSVSGTRRERRRELPLGWRTVEYHMISSHPMTNWPPLWERTTPNLSPA